MSKKNVKWWDGGGLEKVPTLMSDKGDYLHTPDTV